MNRQEGLKRLIAIMMNKDEEWVITLKNVIREARDQVKAIEYEEAGDVPEFSSIPAFMRWLGIKRVGFGYNPSHDKFQPVFENGIGMITEDRIHSFYISNGGKKMVIDNFYPSIDSYRGSRNTGITISDVDLSPVVSLLEKHGIIHMVEISVRSHMVPRRVMWMISGRHLLFVGPPEKDYGDQTKTVVIKTRKGMDGAISFGMDTTTGEEYITVGLPRTLVIKDRRHIDAITSWIYGDNVIVTKDVVSISDREILPEDDVSEASDQSVGSDDDEVTFAF